MVGSVLLMVHIVAGSVALVTAVIALITAKGGIHHIRVGRGLCCRNDGDLCYRAAAGDTRLQCVPGADRAIQFLSGICRLALCPEQTRARPADRLGRGGRYGADRVRNVGLRGLSFSCRVVLSG